MRLRGLPYREFTSIGTFAPIRPEVLAQVEPALADLLRHPDAITLRRIAAGRRPVEFAGAAVEHTSDRLDTAAAVQRVRSSVTGTHPIHILLSDERITFAASHAWFDGLGLAELIAAVLATASGTTPVLDGRPPVRFPLVRGLRAVGRSGVRAWRDSRRTPASPPPPAPGSPGASAVAETELSPELVERVMRLPTDGRCTPNARFAAVAVAALRRVHRRSVDVPVTVPISLLRHVGNRRVLGTFVDSQVVGSLHGSDWTPAAISARVREVTTSGAGMVGLAYTVARSLRHASADRRGPRVPGGVAISMVMMRLPAVVPETAWASDRRRSCTATVGAWPSATLLAPAQMGGRWYVTVWDESGDFDLDAFPDALLEEISAREGAALR